MKDTCRSSSFQSWSPSPLHRGPNSSTVPAVLRDRPLSIKEGHSPRSPGTVARFGSIQERQCQLSERQDNCPLGGIPSRPSSRLGFVPQCQLSERKDNCPSNRRVLSTPTPKALPCPASVQLRQDQLSFVDDTCRARRESSTSPSLYRPSGSPTIPAVLQKGQLSPGRPACASECTTKGLGVRGRGRGESSLWEALVPPLPYCFLLFWGGGGDLV